MGLTIKKPKKKIVLTHPHIVSPCRFFDRCIWTGTALKLILHDFSSNFLLNMWAVKFFNQ